MRRSRLVLLIVALVLLVSVSAVMLTGCGNRYYYNELFTHVKMVGEKAGESYRISVPFELEGRAVTFELYVNKTYSHFVALSVEDKANRESLQLSIDTDLSGKYSLIPKLRDVDEDGDEYIMCEYTPISKKMSVLDDKTHILPENRERCMAVIDRLLPSLLSQFETYIVAHSSEMHDIELYHLGFAPRPIVESESTDNAIE